MREENKNTITICGENYWVFPLSEAKRTVYWEWIDELAKKHLNPWQDLYEKVKDIPPGLQEVIFCGVRKSLFPLTKREKKEICCRVQAIEKLACLAIMVHDEKPHDSLFMSDLYELPREELLQVYVDLTRLLGDSYTFQLKPAETERHLSGPEAIDYLRGQVYEWDADNKRAKRQAAEISAAGKEPAEVADG